MNFDFLIPISYKNYNPINRDDKFLCRMQEGLESCLYLGNRRAYYIGTVDGINIVENKTVQGSVLNHLTSKAVKIALWSAIIFAAFSLNPVAGGVVCGAISGLLLAKLILSRKRVDVSAQKDSSTFYKLGKLYCAGVTVEKNEKKGISYYRQAADLGHISALKELGKIYKSKNLHTIAFNYYKKAAELEDVDSTMVYAEYLLAPRDDMKLNSSLGIQMLEKAIELGSVNAKAFLGFCYYNGQHVEKDIVKAYKYISEAANAGDPEAMYYLAIGIENEDYIAEDGRGRDYWFCRAAELGLDEAKVCYVAAAIQKPKEFRDLALEKKYLNSAAANNNWMAMCLLYRGVSKGDYADLRDQFEARYWEKRALKTSAEARDFLYDDTFITAFNKDKILKERREKRIIASMPTDMSEEARKERADHLYAKTMQRLEAAQSAEVV